MRKRLKGPEMFVIGSEFPSMEEEGAGCPGVDPVESFVCTRKPGHPGPHVAHINAVGEPEEACAIWDEEPREEENVQ